MMAKEVCTFASLLVLFSISVSAKSTIDDVLSPSSLSFTRKLLLSDECLNDELLMIEDEEFDKVSSAYLETCPAVPEVTQDEDGTVTSYKLVFNNTGCDSSSVREYCDANYETAELPNVELFCTGVSFLNETDGTVVSLPPLTQQFIGEVNCIAKSCPDISEWSIEDIVQNAEKQGGINATCTATAIEEEKEDNSSELNDNDTSSASVERTTAMFLVVLSSVIATFAIQW